MISIILSLLGAFITALVLERSSPISRWLIEKSCATLPIGKRELRRDQWIADNNEIAGSAWTLMHALGCSWLCREAILSTSISTLRRRLPLLRKGNASITDQTFEKTSQLHLLEPISQYIPARSAVIIDRFDVDTIKSADIDPQEFYLWAYLCSGRTIQNYADDNGMSAEKAEQIASEFAAKFDEPDLESILDRLHMIDFRG